MFGSCEATDTYQISLKLVGFFRGVFGSFLKDSFPVVKQSVRFFGSFRAVSTPRYLLFPRADICVDRHAVVSSVSNLFFSYFCTESRTMRVKDLYVVSNKYEISGGIPLHAEIL